MVRKRENGKFSEGIPCSNYMSNEKILEFLVINSKCLSDEYRIYIAAKDFNIFEIYDILRIDLDSLYCGTDSISRSE